MATMESARLRSSALQMTTMPNASTTKAPLRAFTIQRRSVSGGTSVLERRRRTTVVRTASITRSNNAVASAFLNSSLSVSRESHGMAPPERRAGRPCQLVRMNHGTGVTGYSIRRIRQCSAWLT